MTPEAVKAIKAAGSLLTIVTMYFVVKNAAPNMLPVWFLALCLTALGGYAHNLRSNNRG